MIALTQKKTLMLSIIDLVVINISIIIQNTPIKKHQKNTDKIKERVICFIDNYI